MKETLKQHIEDCSEGFDCPLYPEFYKTLKSPLNKIGYPKPKRL